MVKLENANDWALTLLFYVHGGEPFETTVPLGTYVLKYVVGNKWCGAAQLFGNTTAERGRTVLIFSRTYDGYDGHTVTLYPLPHGNFETEVIPREQF